MYTRNSAYLDDSLPIRICGCGQFCTDILVHRRFKRILSCLFMIGIYVLARVCATIITCRIVNVCYEVNYMHIKYIIIAILYIVPLRGECVLSLWCHNNNFVFFIHLNNLEVHATTNFSCFEYCCELFLFIVHYSWLLLPNAHSCGPARLVQTNKAVIVCIVRIQTGQQLIV